jgi:hypothetical protein
VALQLAIWVGAFGMARMKWHRGSYTSNSYRDVADDFQRRDPLVGIYPFCGNAKYGARASLLGWF